jgi:lipid II:glycine glycyltransferase (peptidoglycan interpeptide bridge formation enzyme)
VHSLEEICLLAERFPANIRLVTGRVDGKIEAGVVLFMTEKTHHAQYIASSPIGHKVCALDAIFDYCIAMARVSGVRYFDFGISNEEQGQVLNEGLYQFKIEFGGGGTIHEFYQLEL